MPQKRPQHAIGIVQSYKFDGSTPRPEYFGTCFAFRYPNCFLTASHCIPPSTNGERIVVTMPRFGKRIFGFQVIRHEHADIAILKLNLTQDEGDLDWDPLEGYHDIEPFTEIELDVDLGTDLGVLGFPQDIFGDRLCKERFFKTHVQCDMRHEDTLARGKYRYHAIEMGIPCTEGLSGGPIFRLDRKSNVVGIVTGNLESTTFFCESSEECENGNIMKETTKRVVTYGVGLILRDISGWLDEHIPPNLERLVTITRGNSRVRE